LFCFIAVTSCGLDVPPCPDDGSTNLILRASDNVFPVPDRDTPVLVQGRACTGPEISAEALTQDYEIILYAETDRFYIQPFADRRAHIRIRADGRFSTYSHEANCLHVILTPRGIHWPAQLTALPDVSGPGILATTGLCLDTDPTAAKAAESN
jgi:hypothetical protein